MTLILLAHLRRGQTVSAISLVLAGLSLSLLLGFCAGFATARLRLRTEGDGLVIEHRVLGVTWRRARVPLTALRGAYAVHPDGRPAIHLLLQTVDGPLAYRAAAELAQAAARALDPASAEPHSALPRSDPATLERFG
jgi:hypothetical protein